MTGDRSNTKRAGHRGAALALMLAASFMVILDFGVVNIALASIERDLHAGAAIAQWVITAYAITFGGFLVLGGRLGDLFGRRHMFAVGLVLFSIASLAGGLSTTVAVLIAARALQGLGAAVIAPTALSLITTTFAEGPARTRALSFYGATAAIGFVAGLVLGGLLVQFFDWRAVLWVNVPVGLAAAACTPFLLTEPPRPAGALRLDLSGAVLVTAGITAVVYGVSRGPVSGWSAPPTAAAFLAAAALLLGFVVVERRHPDPLVRIGILRLAPLRTANVITVLLGAWTAGELLVMPLYLQLVLHYSPLATGLAMLPQGIVGFVAVIGGLELSRRVGLGRLLVLSVASAGLGLAMLGVFADARSYPLLAVAFAFTGLGNAICAFVTTVVATQGVADAEQGLASGLVNMSRQLGAAVGVAVVVAIVGSGASSGRAMGSDRMAMLAVAIAAAAALAAASTFSRSRAG